MADSFAVEPARTPAAIGDISIVLTDYLDNSEQQDTIGFEVQIAYDDGTVRTRSGNLIPYMTAQQISAVQGFAAAMRTKAENEVLGL